MLTPVGQCGLQQRIWPILKTEKRRGMVSFGNPCANLVADAFARVFEFANNLIAGIKFLQAADIRFKYAFRCGDLVVTLAG